jgi:hypothetical protein
VVVPRLQQGQAEHGHSSRAVRRVASTLTDGLCEVYPWLKSILSATAVNEAESSLLHWGEGHPRSSKRGNNFLTSRL